MYVSNGVILSKTMLSKSNPNVLLCFTIYSRVDVNDRYLTTILTHINIFCQSIFATSENATFNLWLFIQ